MQYLWLGILIVALVVEATTAGLLSIWFVPPALVSMLLAFFNVPTYLQVVVFFGLSLLLIVFSRTIWKKYTTFKPIEPTNADALIGKTGIVTSKINNINSVGEVKISGQYWSARSFDGSEIPEDSMVEIVSIEGVKLICKAIE